MRAFLIAILFFTFLSVSDLKAQSADTSALPAPVAKLLPDIQEKSLDEVRCLIIKKLGKPRTVDRIEKWDIADGALTFYRYFGPSFHDTKSNNKYWLIKTNTRVEENIFAQYAMRASDRRFIGFLTIDSDSKYNFKESGAKSDNFFARNPVGKVSVTYPGSVKPDTLLASLEENTIIAHLVFTSNDSDYSAAYSITSSKNSRRLDFVGNGEMPFSMYKFWKDFYRPPLSELSKAKLIAASDSFPPKPIVKLASEIQEALLGDNTSPDDIRCQIVQNFGGPHRQVGSGVIRDEWDIAGGILTFDPMRGPTFLDTKSKKTYWLIKTKNKVEDNLFGGYEMYDRDYKIGHLGNLKIDFYSKYSFKGGKNPDNFFARNPVGKVTVTYIGSVKAETLLDSLEEDAKIAQLVFTSNDGEHSASYSIANSKNSRSLIFVGKGDETFEIFKFWKNYWK